MELNFYDNRGFQPETTHPKHSYKHLTKAESLWSHCAIFWCDGRSRENSCLKQLAFATAHLQALDFVGK